MLRTAIVVDIADALLQSASGFKTKDQFGVSRSLNLKANADDCLQTEVVKHIETTLARSLFNCDELFVFPSLP